MRLGNVSNARGLALSDLWLQDGLLRLVNDQNFSVPCDLKRIIQSTIRTNPSKYQQALTETPRGPVNFPCEADERCVHLPGSYRL